uniref:Thymidine diphospho-4-keto-rhamnose 3,5-epimerase n=1 Tax=Syphacia muris TaxID=451379 RepID=A0A0N5APQ8_9BILA
MAAVHQRTLPVIQEIPEIEGLKLILPKIFPDNRGYFSETYNVVEWSEKLGFNEVFKQDNHSFSKFGVLRGLHIQPKMGKLVSVAFGKIFDVAVDVRPHSKTFGKWHAQILDETGTHFWIPDGFLHGFYTMSPEGAHVTYKCTDVYNPKTEFGINPFDVDIGIQWPFSNIDEIVLSERDRSHHNLESMLPKLREICKL